MNSQYGEWFKACHYGTVSVIRELAANPEFNVNQLNSVGRNALFMACYNGYIEIVRILLAHPNIHVGSEGVNDTTSCMMYAALGKNFDVVRILLDHPTINVNRRGWRELTPLSWSIMRNSEELFEMLMNHSDIDVNVGDIFGWRPISWATRYRRTSMVRRLLAHPDIDVNIMHTDTNEYYTLLHIANEYQMYEIRDMLIQHQTMRQAVAEVVLRLSVPPNQEDAIYREPIVDGTPMVDFHEERSYGRYYTKASYDSLILKRNPATRRVIYRSDLILYIAEVKPSS